MKLALFVAVLAIACGHSPKHGDGDGIASGTASATPAPDAAVAIGSGTAASAGALTKDECAAFFGHVVDVGMAEKRKTMAADQAPNADDAAKAKQKLVDEGMAECLQMPRAMFDCAMK